MGRKKRRKIINSSPKLSRFLGKVRKITVSRNLHTGILVLPHFCSPLLSSSPLPISTWWALQRRSTPWAECTLKQKRHLHSKSQVENPCQTLFYIWYHGSCQIVSIQSSPVTWMVCTHLFIGKKWLLSCRIVCTCVCHVHCEHEGFLESLQVDPT